MLQTWNMFDYAKNCELIIITNAKNMRQNDHQYKVGEKLLVKRTKNSKHELELMGPFPITQINYNGTVFHTQKMTNDTTNIHRIKPFFN